MARKKQAEPLSKLSRRERQIMEIVYARGGATSAEVLEAMADPPSYSAVRALMRILVEKKMLKYRRDGLRYVFEPVVEAGEMRSSALSRLMRSLFGNSPVSLVETLLDADEVKISDEELRHLKELIARKERSSKQGKP